MNQELKETIREALEKKEFYKRTFVTVWERKEKSYGFNFDEKPMGYVMYDGAIKYQVVYVG